MRRGFAILTIGIGAGLTLACSTPLDSFHCETNADCQSTGQAGGECEDTKLCSFADPSCTEAGRRYGSASGEQSNECVASGSPDASTVVPEADARPIQPDATPVDAAPACDNDSAAISMTVHDDSLANDFLKVRIAGENFFYCQADPNPGDEDTVTSCDVCIPIGTAIQLSWFEGVDRITQFTTDCHDPCPILNEFSCDFTVTVACSATAVYDVSTPPKS
jgi:hypothetical protein